MTWWRRLREFIAADGIVFRFVPERRLALALALSAPVWLLPGRAGTFAGLAALGVIVALASADLLRLPARGALELRRDVPPAVGIGDTVEGGYTITSHWPRDVAVTLYDRFPEAVRGGVEVLHQHLGAFSSHHVRFELEGRKRGRVPLGRLGARVRTELGLVAARFAFHPTDEILVLPSVSGVRRYRLLAMQHRLDTIGVRALRRKGEGQGFAGLRDYALGDDPRHVDWKASARKSKLITREYTIERSQTVFTMIDAGRGMTQLAGTYPRFEHALSSALVLTDIAANAGDRVGTLAFDHQIRAFVPAVRSRGALQLVRDALVPVVATTSEPDYAAAFRFLAVHQRKRALIVFFTDVIDVRASAALVAYVSRSAARHVALVVALRNDAIFAASVPRATGNAVQLYENAAAEELVQAREEALERMRRAGAVVLDVSPQVMTAKVINRYLELKGRGAI